RPALILPDRTQDHAEGRIDDTPDAEDADEEDRQHEIVDVEWLPQIDEAQQEAARNALNAVLTVGEGRLQTEEIEHLRQSQRDHGKIDSLPAYGEETHYEAKYGRTGRSDQYADFRRHSPDLDRVGAEIGSSPKEGGVAEGEQARIAEQEVEGAGEERKAHDLHQEDRVHEEGRRQQPENAQQHQQPFCPASRFRTWSSRGQVSHLMRPFRTVQPGAPEARWP